jgi:hypothetical protein
VAWGAGEPNNPTDTFGFGQSTIPEGLSGVVAIAAGGWQSLALHAPPSLAPPQILLGGSAQLALSGSVGLSYTLQASTNLTDWTRLTTLVATNANMTVVDAASTNFNRRFYRVVMP